MNIPTSSPLRPPSRVAMWSGYIAGIFRRSARATPLAAPLPISRRQTLLLAQGLKRNEQRIRMLELLREVKGEHSDISKQQS